MSEPTFIQQQRDNLRNFRQANVQFEVTGRPDGVSKPWKFANGQMSKFANGRIVIVTFLRMSSTGPHDEKLR